MIILITGASHTGKTVLAQRLDDSGCTMEWLLKENQYNRAVRSKSALQI